MPIPPPFEYQIADVVMNLGWRYTWLIVETADVKSIRSLEECFGHCQHYIDHQMSLNEPFPVAVIGVKVEDARGAKIGVPLAIVDAAKARARRLWLVFRDIFK